MEELLSSAAPCCIAWSRWTRRTERSVFDVVLPAGPDPSRGFTSEFRPDMLGGIVVLKHKGMTTPKPLSEEPLYQTIERTPRGKEKEVNLTFIPYYAWANRLPGAMEVWIPYLETRSALPVQKAR